MREPIEFEWPPLRTDSICIGTLQLASKMAALRAADIKKPPCAMWAQLDGEVGIMFRAVDLAHGQFKYAKSELVRWDDLKAHGERVIQNALTALANQLDAE